LGQGGLAGAFRPVDFGDAPARDAARAQGAVEGQGTGGDDVDLQVARLSQPHHGTLAKTFGQIRQRCLQRLPSSFVNHYAYSKPVPLIVA
jgi:predicted nucleic acid-binding protein